jgi:general secretion pathway protein L
MHSTRPVPPNVLILTPADFSVAPASGPSAVLDWASSVNGETVIDSGQSAAAALPRDDDVVLVLPPRVVSWHRIQAVIQEL